MPICSAAGYSTLGNYAIVANAAARPTGAARYPGVMIMQLDTFGVYLWDGSAWQLVPIASPAADIQTFTSGSGTWTKPSWARVVSGVLIGAGGGGGSGRVDAASTNRGGGGGGGAGGRTVFTLDAALLGPTAGVVIGVGGAGAPSPVTNTTNGNPGTDGGATYVVLLTGQLLAALGGHAGAGGSQDAFFSSQAFGGASGNGMPGEPGTGGGTLEGAGAGAQFSNSVLSNGGNSSAGPGGGGAGGGVNSVNTTISSTAGGVAGPAAGGSTSGGAGAAAATNSGLGGGGGGGGSYPNVSGGAGGYPGGAGGGGCGMLNGFLGVVGGAGAAGFAIIISER